MFYSPFQHNITTATPPCLKNKVRLLDASTPAGASVQIDIEANTPKIEIKRQLALKTGLWLVLWWVGVCVFWGATLCCSLLSPKLSKQHSLPPPHHQPKQNKNKKGVPIEHVKVMLAGIDEMVMGDRRAMRFAHCGTASNAYFVVAAASAGGAGAAAATQGN